MTAIGKRGRPAPPHPARFPARGKRAKKRLDKRERIRAAAFELFSTQGFEATTTKAVAKLAGVAAGTLFLYADDKPDLLFLVFHERLQRVTDERLGSLPNASLEDQLMHVFRGLFEMYAVTPEMAAAFVRELPGSRGRNARALDALTFGFLHRVASLVRDAQQQGEVGEHVAPLLAAQNIFMLYFGALLAWINGMASLEAALDPLLANSLKLQFEGLLPRS